MPATSVNLKNQTQQLEEKFEQLKAEFTSKHREIADWLKINSGDLTEFKKFAQQLMAAITLAGQIAASQPVEAQVQEQLAAIQQKNKDDLLSKISAEEFSEIIKKMTSFVNQAPGHIDQQDELYLEQQLTDLLGFEVTAQLEGRRLNHSVGIMGGEQHLRRYPTDSLDKHDAYLEAGIAPNRGAFGWFTEEGVLTEKGIEREKYYFAVQTLYLPDWNQNHQELKPWYKFRKMIVINPAEELAVVGVVADAGPALWVKKQFGGSPEVIREGKIWSPKSKGRVILYFVDDPEDRVRLGPIDLKELSQLKLIKEENE
ncbi:MAG: hypothetical protein GF381_01115 [Candidatus Pacebacteria bacterium]|nr:hypothetical protein [Candidatus Paceibacterota bacterium]